MALDLNEPLEIARSAYGLEDCIDLTHGIPPEIVNAPWGTATAQITSYGPFSLSPGQIAWVDPYAHLVNPLVNPSAQGMTDLTGGLDVPQGVKHQLAMCVEGSQLPIPTMLSIMCNVLVAHGLDVTCDLFVNGNRWDVEAQEWR